MRAPSLLLCALCGAAPIAGQDGPPVDSVVATPQGRYRANAFHRFFLGDLNRTLWETPATAQVLDLETYAGGLTPLRRGGGLQTQSLRLQGADGQVYNFRSIDKDATRTLDPRLREALPARVLQDQIGALFPLSAMVVAPLLEAADVLHPDPTLVVMPNDPALGEFREEYAGLLGWIEVRPDEGPDGEPGFAGSSRVIGSDRLLERLEESPDEKVNAESFLRARLMDVFVGDWDRHPDQWRWAGFESETGMSWEPIPRDRDWALARLDGLLVFAAGRYFVHYRGFDLDYEPAFNATFTGRALDRRILQSLGKEDFTRVARELQTAISDDVIAATLLRLPPRYKEQLGSWLEEALTRRRDGLEAFAGEYYALLAGWVDVYGTDEEELAVVERLPGDHLRVRIHEVDDGSPVEPPHFDRTFDGSETREVRLFMHGDDDRVEVGGSAPSGIVVRAVGGGGDDQFRDDRGGRTYFYDDRGDNEFSHGNRDEFDESDWDEPPDQSSATHQSKARDWGSWTLAYPIVSYSPDLGVYAGGGVRRDSYGFRHYPYKTRLTLSATLGPAVGRGQAALAFDFPLWDRGPRGLLDASVSGKEFARFYGFGNDSPDEPRDDAARFTRDEIQVSFLVSSPDTAALRIGLGPTFTFIDHDRIAGKVIGELQPYGLDRFAQVGLLATAALDYRDHRTVPRSGWIAEVEGRYFPGLLDVESGYAGVRGNARWYASPDVALDPVLALRVGGERVWGAAPYFDAATLGGPASTLGYTENRFAGDALVHANAMLSVAVTPFYVLLPGELGLLAMAETGRVYVDGASPGGWHASYGGGVWLSFVNPHMLVSLTLARSEERTGLYFGLGWPF